MEPDHDADGVPCGSTPWAPTPEGSSEDDLALVTDLDALHERAAARDIDARARDDAAQRRDDAAVGREDDASPGLSAADDALFAARDRAAAALDRREAALDRQQAREYRDRAYRDELTGALQRAAGRDQLSQAVDRANRSGEPLTVAFLDVDHLKQLNDLRGHAAGDELLHAVGASLLLHLRSSDVVVRYGGDEFVCAVASLSLEETTQRLRDVAAAVHRAVPGATVSVGLAALLPGDTLDHVIARADCAMYAQRNTTRRLTIVPLTD